MGADRLRCEAGLSDRDECVGRFFVRRSTGSSPGRFDVLAGKPPTTTAKRDDL